MTIVDLLISELNIYELDEVQVMELASRLLDCAIEKINNKKECSYENE